jgi:hypothetical protein
MKWKSHSNVECNPPSHGWRMPKKLNWKLHLEFVKPSQGCALFASITQSHALSSYLHKIIQYSRTFAP